MKENMPDEHILFEKYGNNTCLTYNNAMIISINKLLKYFHILIWKIDYSALRKLTVQINGPTIYFFRGYESCLQNHNTIIHFIETRYTIGTATKIQMAHLTGLQVIW